MVWRLRCLHRQRGRLGGSEMAHRAPRDAERVGIVRRHVVGDAGGAAVHVGAAELLGAHLLAGRRLHQRRAAEKDRALAAHDDALVGHGRHVGAARGARAHDHGDLRDALGRHVGLVVEDAAEVLAVGKHLVLVGQVGAAGVHQVDARQAVLLGDLLGAQVLLDRDRVVGAALHRGVVGDDHALAPGHPADAGDDARRGHGVVVDAVGGELRELEKRRSRVEQQTDALAHRQLAPRHVALARRSAAAARDLLDFGAQVRDQRAHGVGVGAKSLASRVDASFEDGHGPSRGSPAAGLQPPVHVVEPVVAPEGLAVDDEER